jgi:hypothetical protein
VANTIYYRRRKGTVAILEQIAGDVTGWDARVVEFFRRLGRTRHGLDPEIGLPSATSDPLGNRRLQLASGLVGRLTNSAIGGTADLRSVYGASKTGTAFDEFFYTPDARRGAGARGWYNIPRLGVFLWRLYSFPQTANDPNDLLSVPVAGKAPCDAHYTFDPTGRLVPLFASASRSTDREQFGATWVSPREWELPGPIAKALFDDDRRADKDHPDLYTTIDGSTLAMRSVGVFRTDTSDLVPLADLRVWPELGRFAVPAADSTLRVWYHYGFSSRLGAGAYDRRAVGELAPAPGTDTEVRDGDPLPAIGATSTLTVADSLTYTTVTNAAGINDVTVRSKNGRRPLIRLPETPATDWVFTGAPDSTLRLEGLFISGGDVVLRGEFDQVAISFSTFDPGQAAEAGSATPFAKAIDERELRPTTLWIEAKVGQLTVDRCITGPIRTRHDGAVAELIVRDSILQSIVVDGGDSIALSDFKDIESFARELKESTHPVAVQIQEFLAPATNSLLNLFHPPARVSQTLATHIVDDLNEALKKPELFDIPGTVGNPRVAEINRRFLLESFPLQLANLALAFNSGGVSLERTTVLGPLHVHRIDVSESILNDVARVENAQHGCVRFSAWSTGSILPRKYECVEIAPRTALFTSRHFAQPGYAQLRSDVDRFVKAVSGGGAINRSSIREGSQNGSEMGAFSSELASIKERSLLIKFEEFMPVGLVPVIVHVT